ncbi:hypothetical protein [Vulcanococcus sp.]|jgi:hypothetical protein|uniref:hypothetical protein n=1 Tax=Vulcanococcus sp. TaxID=2856995 RepID=UPI0037DA6C13
MQRLTPIAGALAAATALALSPVAGFTQGVNQTLERIDQLQQQAPARQRAMNLARNTVVKLNGGLSQYMPAACMFASGGSGGSCLVSSNDQGFLFRFNGGAPGWQQLGTAPTTTSEILISPDGRTVAQLIYNGPLR